MASSGKLRACAPGSLELNSDQTSCCWWWSYVRVARDWHLRAFPCCETARLSGDTVADPCEFLLLGVGEIRSDFLRRR